MNSLNWSFSESPDAEAQELNRKMRFKYCLDRVMAWGLLLVLSPVFLLVAILIKWDGWLHPESRGPILYTEPRISEGRIFYIFKFRTVSEKTIQWIQEKPESRSITNFELPRTVVGQFILRHYFDELPQLINIARGEMTFVGLRPHILAHTQEEVEQGFKYRLKIRAGLFGVPQACKRDRKFQAIIKRMARHHRPDIHVLYTLDGLYVRKCKEFSPWRIFLFDLFLVGRCAMVILRGED